MSTFRRRRREEELDRELAFHIEQETEKLVSAGFDPAEARRRALVGFGGVERFREATLDEQRERGFDVLARDIRHGARGLIRSPLHTAASVLSLALGIGAAVAMFTVADGVLLRPLPYGSADRVVNAYEAREAGGIRTPSYPSFEDWHAGLSTFDAITFIRGEEFRLRSAEGTQRLLAGYVTDDFFRTLETTPLLGRGFDDSDGVHAVVLSHALWLRAYGGDPSIIGRIITTADASFTVTGVMPPGFRIPAWADVWAPLRALPADATYALTQRDVHVDAEVWGLVREGVTLERAQQDLAGVVSRLSEAYGEEDDWTTAVLTPVRDEVVGNDAVQLLRILIAAVALVLLIVFVNVAGLQLARGSTRTREFAIRATLGASRGRLVRQLLTESLLLAIAGGILGVLAAMLAVRGLSTAFPQALPRLEEVGLDGRALAFALVTSVMAAVMFGIIPALRSASPDLAPALRAGTGAGVSGRTAGVRSALVVAQIALAIVLTVGSGLLLRSFRTLQQVDLGFDSSGVVTLRVFPPVKYADEAAATELYRQLHEAARRVPGVADVALTNHMPLTGGFMVTRVLTGGPPPPTGENAGIRTVSIEYFDVLRSRLLQGRLLQESDYAGPGGGVVINRALAEQFFPGEQAVGRTVTVFHSVQGRPAFGTPMQAQVVGVIEDERIFDLTSAPPPVVYVPNSWMVWGNITLSARTTVPVQSVIPALRQVVHEIDQDIPVAGPSQQAEWRPLDDFIGQSLTSRRLMTGLITAFAAAALVLALLGIFGMTAYMVTRRTREIGVRVAIGATPGVLVRMVLGHALRLTLIGIAVGVPAAWAATRLLRTQLVGVSATDPLTAAAVVLTFITAAAAAACIPTMRALRIPATQALKTD